MNQKIVFSVICNNEESLNQIISWYNSNYKTDFKIINVIHDEVDFADIEVTQFKPDDIFSLGYQFGREEQVLRQQGKIDW